MNCAPFSTENGQRVNCDGLSSMRSNYTRYYESLNKLSHFGRTLNACTDYGWSIGMMFRYRAPTTHSYAYTHALKLKMNAIPMEHLFICIFIMQ